MSVNRRPLPQEWLTPLADWRTCTTGHRLTVKVQSRVDTWTSLLSLAISPPATYQNLRKSAINTLVLHGGNVNWTIQSENAFKWGGGHLKQSMWSLHTIKKTSVNLCLVVRNWKSAHIHTKQTLTKSAHVVRFPFPWAIVQLSLARHSFPKKACNRLAGIREGQRETEGSVGDRTRSKVWAGIAR